MHLDARIVRHLCASRRSSLDRPAGLRRQVAFEWLQGVIYVDAPWHLTDESELLLHVWNGRKSAAWGKDIEAYVASQLM